VDDEPFRPDIVLWVESPSGLIVAQEVLGPDEADGAVARVLGAALEQPATGAQPAPDAVRVEDPALVEALRSVLPGDVPVRVAPTPEIDEVMAALVEAMPPEEGEDRSYLEDGRIVPQTVERLFTAAQALHAVAPWQVATDDRVLRMDIPGLGVEGACVAIIGNLDESLGLLVFPSLEGYEAFLDATEDPVGHDGRLDLGTSWLALTFEPAEEVPPTMRREAMSHGWSLAGADAYPVVDHYERDGMPRLLAQRDLRVATACAMSLASFFVRNRAAFEARAIEPVCESYFDDDDLEVCLTLPYEAHALFELPERPAAGRAAAKVGRNDPCPCGSGRKYKKCHLAADQEAATPPRERDPVHELDEGLVDDLMEFARERFGPGWLRGGEVFADPVGAIQLSAPWFAYHHEVEGKPAVEWYLAERGKHLSRATRGWLTAQRAAWLSVWEVTAVEPGSGMTLRDLLSDETREVCEVLASQTLVVRDAVLARVVDHDGASHLCGMYPSALAPIEAAEVVRRARGRLRRKRAVPVERLREQAIGRYLIRRWEEAVAERKAQPAGLRALANTDGDPFLLTRDHFAIAPGARPAIEAKLAAMEGVEPPDEADEPPAYHFLRAGNAMHASWDNTLIGEARFQASELVLETNSRERADALRARIESACGDGVRHRLREHEDPLSEKAALPSPSSNERAAEPPTPEAAQLLLAFKEQHYVSWPDEPLPALGGKTPRAAAATAQGRSSVDVLLKDMENHEQRAGGEAPFDFSGLRRELGLD